MKGFIQLFFLLLIIKGYSQCSYSKKEYDMFEKKTSYEITQNYFNKSDNLNLSWTFSSNSTCCVLHVNVKDQTPNKLKTYVYIQFLFEDESTFKIFNDCNITNPPFYWANFCDDQIQRMELLNYLKTHYLKAIRVSTRSESYDYILTADQSKDFKNQVNCIE